MTAPISLTLPGPPVTRSVTWEQVRAYLRAEGWEPNPKTAPDSRVAMWERAGTYDVLYVGGTSEREEHNVMLDTTRILARLASVSPGEMLARIADGAEPAALTHAEAIRALPIEPGKAEP